MTEKSVPCLFKWCRLPLNHEVHRAPFYYLSGAVMTEGGLDGNRIPRHPFREGEVADPDALFASESLARVLTHMLEEGRRDASHFGITDKGLLILWKDHAQPIRSIAYMLYWAGFERGRTQGPAAVPMYAEPEKATEPKAETYPESCPINPRDPMYG